MRLHEALAREALAKDDERAYKALAASYFALSQYGAQFYWANSSDTKRESIQERNLLTNPFVRVHQKTTRHVSPDDMSITLVGEHDSGTSGAAGKGHELHESGGSELLAQLVNNCWPSEQALMSAVVASELSEPDYVEAFGEECGRALETIMQGLNMLARHMLRVDSEELPKASKKSETQKVSSKDVSEMERELARSLESKGESSDSESSDSESPAQRKARLEELQQVKYIGSATASAMLEAGWHWKRLRELSELHGRDVALSELEDMLNERQQASLREALPAQIG